MKMRTEFRIREFAIVDVGISEEIHTDLPLGDVVNTFKEFGLNKIASDENNGKIQLRNNFAVKINTTKFDENNSLTLEFSRYYHRFYAAYVVAVFVSVFGAEFLSPYARVSAFYLIILLLPIPLIWMLFELIRGIKNIKAIDYSKEADRIFLEISNAIRERENDYSAK